MTPSSTPALVNQRRKIETNTQKTVHDTVSNIPNKSKMAATAISPSARKIYPASYCVVISTLLVTLTSTVTSTVTPSMPTEQDVAIVRTMNISHALNHMAVDSTGYIYLGAVNAIYKLHPVNFENGKQIERTGPIMDSPNCIIPFDASSDCGKQQTDNHNKVLVVDTDNARLLTCGSVRQGTCQFRQLSDISDKTEYQTSRDHYVAANDASSSTVAFIAPGPPDPSSTKVIYSGTTATKPTSIRSIVPAIASRKLSGPSALDYTKVFPFSDKGSYLKLDENRKDYNVTYIAGFHVGHFSYFLSVRPIINTDASVDDGKYVTMISRICDSDEELISFVEIPLMCRGGRRNYNLLQAAAISNPGSTLAAQMQISTGDKILIATFSESETNSSPVPKQSAGICVYSFKDINNRFLENIRNCYAGPTAGTIITPYLDAGPHECIAASGGVEIDSSYCGFSEGYNTPITGSTAMVSTPVITLENKLGTAIAISSVEEYTIAFLGTHDGHLKKMVVQMDGAGSREYADLVIHEGHSILRDMKFDMDKAHIYMMTEHKIFKVKVSSCERLSKCRECALMSMDPYCGWCSLERRCSHKKQCANSNLPNYWLSSKTWGCVQITRLDPPRASVYKQVTVSVTVEQLPQGTKDRFLCMFDDIEVEPQKVDSTTITCPTPPPPHVPQILREDQQDHVNITLSIKSVDTDVSFVERPFTFFNCSVHSSCTMCTMAKWDCEWCIHDNRCIGPSTQCPNRGQPVADKNMCPQLIEPSAPTLVPVGVEWEIQLRGKNLPEPLDGQGGYQCIFHHRSPPTTVNARRIDNGNIVCEAAEYNYIPYESEKKAKVDVVWNTNYYIDDENDVQVTFYKCEVMGEDCSLCISLEATKPQYNCQWCGRQGCLHSKTCMAKFAPITSSSCPRAELRGVQPLTGPLGGNTPITITGSNLGTTYAQIRKSITVAGRPCIPIEEEYMVARKIVCRTTKVDAPTSGAVIVKLSDTNTSWSQDFVYQDPVLEGLHPKIGPIAGGTEVTIKGKNLNTGAIINASLDSLKCHVNKEGSATSLVCETSPVTKPRTTSSVRVSFDGSMKRLDSGVTFNYTHNPNITRIYPRETYTSGGRSLTVEGQMFDIIQKPYIFFRSGLVNSSLVECKKANDTIIFCPTPNVHNFLPTWRRRRAASDRKGELEIGFKMDGVREVANMRRDMPWVDSSINVYPDPVFQNFTNGKQEYKGGPLLVRGTGLNAASGLSEITVKVGNQDCEIQTLTADTMVFRPPPNQPIAIDKDDNILQDQLPSVVIKIGNIDYNLGQLEYKTVGIATTSFPDEAKYGIAVTGSFLIMVIIIILVIYRRKSTEAERQFKKMQIQLDTLESNVRNECKQAFAELQTEVTDLTSDINVTGIPFWDYKTYTFKVLFPSHTDHPVLHNKLDQMHNSTTKRPAGQELGLQQFNQLLNSKQFLIIFIRTLESQKNFSIRDKAVVASLLMIVLQDKMEYATEILKALLNELIDRSVEKKHPKLMLRRTESVVEKFLTNWLSICMYSYLKKHAGKSMFLLYKAIKHQTEKGPVDAITSEARYSLSEDRLLREKIEPKTLNINLVVEHEADMVTCKVLDCDTITQAKQKALDAIYMNTPCSRRPSVYDVDLEWRSGRSGHLTLQDEDVTIQMINGWKRVNTLAHYHVPEGAIMAISPTRNKNDMIRHAHGMVEITSGSPLSGITPIITVEEGHKVWHLVKHDDSQNQSRAQKVISEIFLTRLLSTKGTLQQFIDDLFLVILKVDNSVPPAIKYLFDFLDTAARRHNIVDQEVVHTWKSNSLPLRFWVNLIKNPEFVFDIRKSNIVDSCLSVIAQTFMDACSTTEHRLGKDSPSNKLLFARDIPKYRKWVEKFYKEVQEMPPVSEHEMNQAMIELSTHNVVDFNVPCALKELYRYAMQYNIELLEALDDDTSARKLHLSNKFEQVAAVMEGTPLY